MADNRHVPERGLPVLYGEHLLLGAEFDDEGIVARYGSEKATGIDLPLDEGAVLCDLTCFQALYFSGAPAESFATAAFGGRVLEVGDCAFEAVLTGDGSVASIPLLARTGTFEYVAIDGSPRADVLGTWLSFLSSVSQDGFAPYAGLVTDDVTGTHVILGIAGPSAPSVLSDYLGEQELPKRGEVRPLKLDAIPCIAMRPHLGVTDCFVIMVPPSSAVALWRSLLSFGQVTPIGMDAIRELMHEELPWTGRLRAQDTLRVAKGELAQYALIREQGSFVGARGLRSASGGSGAS